MLVTTAMVRRSGNTVRLDAAELVPGDVILVDEQAPLGDRVTALFMNTMATPRSG